MVFRNHISHVFFFFWIEKFHTQLTNQTNANSLSDRATFPGYKGEFSTNLEFLYPENISLIQCYRVMNRKGVVLDPSQDPQVNKITSYGMCEFLF
jgi:ABC-type tungstate transport system permease subunit